MLNLVVKKNINLLLCTSFQLRDVTLYVIYLMLFQLLQFGNKPLEKSDVFFTLTMHTLTS